MESKSAVPKQMIIAMKGPEISYNTITAKKVATFLKCPLVNEGDVFKIVQKSLPSTSYRKLSKSSNVNLIFDTVSQISATQINLNLSVIINMELSQRAHYDRLVRLASSTGAALIIIHCKAEKEQGGKGYNGGDFGVGHVPTVSIDATKPFIVEDFVPKMLQAAEKKKSVDLSNYNPEGAASDAHSSDHDKKDKRDIGDMHAHAFELSEEPKKENMSCTKCEKMISSEPTYHCVECDAFVLHKACAESPQPLDKIALADRLQFLMRNLPQKYEFSSSSSIGGCQNCHEFRSSCPDCLFLANIKGEYLPTIHKYRQHKHPLNFIIMPFSLNYQYRCFACDEMGKCVSYKCFQCNYDLHTKCAAKKTATPKEVILQSIDEARDAFQSHFSFVEKFLASHKNLKERQKTALIDTLKRNQSSVKLLDKFSVGFIDSYRTPHPQYAKDLRTLISSCTSSVSFPDRIILFFLAHPFLRPFPSLTRSVSSISDPVEEHYHT